MKYNYVKRNSYKIIIYKKKYVYIKIVIGVKPLLLADVKGVAFPRDVLPCVIRLLAFVLY